MNRLLSVVRSRTDKSLFIIGRVPESIDAYKQALALDPAYALAMFNLGGVYWNSGDREQALLIWRRAVEQFPDHELTARLRSEFPLPL